MGTMQSEFWPVTDNMKIYGWYYKACLGFMQAYRLQREAYPAISLTYPISRLCPEQVPIKKPNKYFIGI